MTVEAVKPNLAIRLRSGAEAIRRISEVKTNLSKTAIDMGIAAFLATTTTVELFTLSMFAGKGEFALITTLPQSFLVVVFGIIASMRDTVRPKSKMRVSEWIGPAFVWGLNLAADIADAGKKGSQL